MSITAGTLERIYPTLPRDKAEKYAPLLAEAMREGNITTERRAAAFLAQLGHESASLKFFEELGPMPYWSKYSGGARYHGRGPIQLTHDYNYRAAGKALGLPLLEHPELAAKPENGFRIAVWFWVTHGLNGLADKGQFRAISIRINGGLNGIKDRFSRWNHIKRLGADILPVQTREEKWVASRARRKASLRRVLARRRELRAAGQIESPDYARTTRQMRGLRRMIEKLNGLIKRERARPN
jgi:predicted chitinase